MVIVLARRDEELVNWPDVRNRPGTCASPTNLNVGFERWS